MTKIETRYCPFTKVKCRGKTCALTTWRTGGSVTITSGMMIPLVTEWICDMSDRVVERE